MLTYVNEIVTIDSYRNEVIMMTVDLIKVTKSFGLKVIQENTKYLVVSKETRVQVNLQVDRYVF